jgi:Icc protein
MNHSPQPNVDRRSFLRIAGGATIGFLGGLGLDRSIAGQAEASPFSFIHMTDMHVQPELDAERGLRQCLSTINGISPRPDFVITGGDLVMDSLAVGRDRLNLQWDIFDRSMKTLELPLHHTIGNHDVVGWSSKAVIKPDEHDYVKKIFAERYGEGRTFRSFDHKGVAFYPARLDWAGEGRARVHRLHRR